MQQKPGGHQRFALIVQVMYFLIGGKALGRIESTSVDVKQVTNRCEVLAAIEAAQNGLAVVGFTIRLRLLNRGREPSDDGGLFLVRRLRSVARWHFAKIELVQRILKINQHVVVRDRELQAVESTFSFLLFCAVTGQAVRFEEWLNQRFEFVVVLVLKW